MRDEILQNLRVSSSYTGKRKNGEKKDAYTLKADKTYHLELEYYYQGHIVSIVRYSCRGWITLNVWVLIDQEG